MREQRQELQEMCKPDRTATQSGLKRQTISVTEPISTLPPQGVPLAARE